MDPAAAAAWFTELRGAVDWRAERRQMYDREVDVPRLTGHYRVMDYATQVHYTHAVPKTNDAVGERISLAFRVRPDRTPPGGAGASGFYR